ncbi:uncharacterized protein FPRO_06405 [Fusarium proliferatum ET1]|uniref:Uncharacterized protein n=1 Tax=Fusarium proliferatum (strain ET1) TaxID=1227346 RepID=A0A1L7VDJ3_FUSPR|nr:uncharacterized protein FPRO_06405 [Fusarium proliferatum ET1]CZR38404.1 uncharacterized protein FPRO_06405 [Fusarium proliferatum ET1]
MGMREKQMPWAGAGLLWVCVGGGKYLPTVPTYLPTLSRLSCLVLSCHATPTYLGARPGKEQAVKGGIGLDWVDPMDHGVASVRWEARQAEGQRTILLTLWATGANGSRRLRTTSFHERGAVDCRFLRLSRTLSRSPFAGAAYL